MCKLSEVEVVQKDGSMKVSRVYSVDSGEYVAVYFLPILVQIVADMGVSSLHLLPGLLLIIGVVA